MDELELYIDVNNSTRWANSLDPLKVT